MSVYYNTVQYFANFTKRGWKPAPLRMHCTVARIPFSHASCWIGQRLSKAKLKSSNDMTRLADFEKRSGLDLKKS